MRQFGTGRAGLGRPSETLGPAVTSPAVEWCAEIRDFISNYRLTGKARPLRFTRVDALEIDPVWATVLPLFFGRFPKLCRTLQASPAAQLGVFRIPVLSSVPKTLELAAL